MDEFGPDGTQAPPPPRFFADPLAGLPAGDAPPEAAVPVVVPAPAVVARVPAAVFEPVRRRPARRQAAPVRPAAPPPARTGRAGLVGCLLALLAVGALLFNVLREIIVAVVDLLR
ncbi:hypothetical protein [Saccharothrix syringae]|uniref:Uncharacterized protein n=1 Tax=Saccharothrix syringae TaxID=103733 RepID=A0A5Q0GSH7_SACSY|nr:hypothetical protein [Saccharothrix syringae]QFZ16322.1 hypothetical protein EKG83_01570 [Saccharothrix syringae]